jgi:hypothetical protein
MQSPEYQGGSFAGIQFSWLDKIVIETFFSVLPSMTSVLKASPTATAGCQGDPHFLARKTFRLPRECDLVLLHSSAFESGLGLTFTFAPRSDDVIVGTSAALRVGSDGSRGQGVYYLNDVLSAACRPSFGIRVLAHAAQLDKQL